MPDRQSDRQATGLRKEKKTDNQTTNKRAVKFSGENSINEDVTPCAPRFRSGCVPNEVEMGTF